MLGTQAGTRRACGEGGAQPALLGSLCCLPQPKATPKLGMGLFRPRRAGRKIDRPLPPLAESSQGHKFKLKATDSALPLQDRHTCRWSSRGGHRRELRSRQREVCCVTRVPPAGATPPATSLSFPLAPRAGRRVLGGCSCWYSSRCPRTQPTPPHLSSPAPQALQDSHLLTPRETFVHCVWGHSGCHN